MLVLIEGLILIFLLESDPERCFLLFLLSLSNELSEEMFKSFLLIALELKLCSCLIQVLCI